MDLNQLAVVKPLDSLSVKHDPPTLSKLRLKQLKTRKARREARSPYRLSNEGFPVTHRMSA